MRRLAIVMAAALLAASAAVAVAGQAGAQAVASIAVAPPMVDPGGVATVSNGPTVPCAPPAGTANPSASVDLFAIGSATPVNRTPYQGVVTPSGSWTVTVRLAPDLPPGAYRVQAGCYTDSGLNSGFGPAYAAGRLDVRLQEPGRPTATPRSGRPGENLQVGSGDAGCTPPAASPSPRVRVSLLDAAKATRAEAEGPVDPGTGRWSIALRVPDLGAQNAEITAVCLARVGASSPYARYQAAPFAVDGGDAPGSTTTTPGITAPPTTVGPGPGPGPGRGPGASTPTPASSPAAPAASLPITPLAVAIVAEPTYTG